MLLFGHLGITLAVGVANQRILPKSPVPETETAATKPPITLLHLLHHFDYRILLLGSLLPDLIDKPIGRIFFYDVFQNGRIFGHTLIFNMCLIALGIYTVARWRQSQFLILAFGSFIHLMLDQMWLNTKTLFWPVYGWYFPKTAATDFIGWLPNMIHTLTAYPSIYIPEIIGVSVLIWFAARLVLKKQVHTFIRTGRYT